MVADDPGTASEGQAVACLRVLKKANDSECELGRLSCSEEVMAGLGIDA